VQLNPAVVEAFYDEIEKVAKKVRDFTFGQHPEAATGYEGHHLAEPPVQVGLLDVPEEVAKGLSPFIQYHRARMGAQHWSNKRLQKRIGKIKEKDYNHPGSHGFFDEARERGLTIPSGAPKKPPYLKEPIDPFKTYLAGFLGAISTGLIAGRTIKSSKDLFDQEATKKLERFLKTKGVGTVPEEGAAYFADPPSRLRRKLEELLPKPPETEGLPAAAKKMKVWPGGQVHIDPKSAFSTYAHEAGHATGGLKKLIGGGYMPAKLYGILGMPAVSLYALMAKGDVSFEPDKKKQIEKVEKAQRLAALSTIPYLPVLAEEARASARGAMFAKRLLGWKGVPGTVARLLPAWGTYAAAGLGPLVAYKQLGKRLEKLRKAETKTAKKPEKRELRKAAEARGHWRKLPVGHKGQDAHGNPIIGKTWVRAKKGGREFAPGIPSAKKVQSIRASRKPEVWNLAVQQHPARKAGDHFDLRLVDPKTQHAHSFVTRKGEGVPGPGQPIIRVKQQPTHTSEYALTFEGEIPKGYGETKPGKKVTQKLNKPVEVLQSSDDFVRFNYYTGQGPQEFILTRDKKRPEDEAWYLINVTKMRKRLDLPFHKPKYKQIAPGAINLEDDDQVMAAKLDGGHNLFSLVKGRRPRIFSYREPKKRETGVIEQSQKVESLYHLTVPKELHNTVLRGELYIQKSDGGPVAAERVGGILNADVWKSRALQKEYGQLRPAIFDVVVFRGKDMTNAPYSERIEALKEVQKHMPQFEIPDLAFTKDEKKALLEAIEKKLHPRTHEGVILWPKSKPGHPTKAKFTVDHDVYVQSITQAFDKNKKPKEEAGALWYSLTPDGPVVGKIGTGFSRNLRQDMWARKNAYVGSVVKLTAEKQTKSGAFTKARFAGWHLDKNPETFWANNPVEK
jgi:hypothetical protein